MDGAFIDRFMVFEPAEKGHGSFVELQGLVEPALVVSFVSLFPQLFVGHETGTAF